MNPELPPEAVRNIRWIYSELSTASGGQEI